MLIFRQLALTKFHYIPKRLYVKRATAGKMNQVHEEIMRYISPTANIKIWTDLFLRVQASDVHQYPDGNALIAQLLGGNTRNCAAKLSVNVSDDEEHVNISIAKLDKDTDFICRLAVPIKASLHIQSNAGVQIRNVFGEDLCIAARKHIRTEEVRAANIKLSSEEGNITCKRLLLGQNTTISAINGNIECDKLQGDRIYCTTHSGNITTDCCYVENSQFETKTGCLQLKNVHKNTIVGVLEKGAINMSGVHGNIQVYTNGGSLNLQLSQLVGENAVIAQNVDEATINISDEVEKTTDIEIPSSTVTLNSSLTHLEEYLGQNNKSFCFSKGEGNVNKLRISSNGKINLGKLSWAESLQSALNANSN